MTLAKVILLRHLGNSLQSSPKIAHLDVKIKQNNTLSSELLSHSFFFMWNQNVFSEQQKQGIDCSRTFGEDCKNAASSAFIQSSAA